MFCAFLKPIFLLCFRDVVCKTIFILVASLRHSVAAMSLVYRFRRFLSLILDSQADISNRNCKKYSDFMKRLLPVMNWFTKLPMFYWKFIYRKKSHEYVLLHVSVPPGQMVHLVYPELNYTTHTSKNKQNEEKKNKRSVFSLNPQNQKKISSEKMGDSNSNYILPWGRFYQTGSA